MYPFHDQNLPLFCAKTLPSSRFQIQHHSDVMALLNDWRQNLHLHVFHEKKTEKNMDDY